MKRTQMSVVLITAISPSERVKLYDLPGIIKRSMNHPSVLNIKSVETGLIDAPKGKQIEPIKCRRRSAVKFQGKERKEGHGRKGCKSAQRMQRAHQKLHLFPLWILIHCAIINDYLP